MDRRSRVSSSAWALIGGALLVASAAAGAQEPGWPEPVEDNLPFSMVIADQLEYRADDGADTLRWDLQGWYGTDTSKLWVKFEGEQETSSNSGDLELQALYSRMIVPFWDLQFGLRHDRRDESGTESNRSFLVVGLDGLAPYRFELEPTLFVSDSGDLSARVTGTCDVLFSQRLILQPRFESNIAIGAVPEFGVGSGLNDVQLGFRLRYEIRRELAPYLGMSWRRSFGEVDDLARADGESVENLAFVMGVRTWF